MSNSNFSDGQASSYRLVKLRTLTFTLVSRSACKSTDGTLFIASCVCLSCCAWCPSLQIPLLQTLPQTLPSGSSRGGLHWYSLLRRTGNQHITGDLQVCVSPYVWLGRVKPTAGLCEVSRLPYHGCPFVGLLQAARAGGLYNCSYRGRLIRFSKHHMLYVLKRVPSSVSTAAAFQEEECLDVLLTCSC